MIREQIIPQEVNDLISGIESKDLKIVDVKLPSLTGYSNYDQFLRVQDVNVVFSQNHFKITPVRVLIHKINKTELKPNLFVPEFVKSFESLSEFKKENGENLLVETTYKEYITAEPTEENPEPFPELRTIKTEQEPVQLKSLSLLLYFFQSENFVKTVESFTIDFINEEISKNPNAFKTI